MNRTPGYLRRELLEFALLSQLAYQATGTRGPSLIPYRMAMVSEIDTAADIHLFIAATLDYVVVSFRGTSDIRNWMTAGCAELQSWPYEVPPPDVHAGIAAGFASARSPMLAAITRYQALLGKPITVVFTGHSLGGALATLAAADFIAQANQNTVQDVKLRTFGSPRVGDGRFARATTKAIDDIMRVVHADDIVPQVPAGFGYSHVGGLVHLKNDGGMVRPWHRAWWRNLLGLNRIIIDTLDGESVRQHLIASYVICISKMKV